MFNWDIYQPLWIRWGLQVKSKGKSSVRTKTIKNEHSPLRGCLADMFSFSDDFCHDIHELPTQHQVRD